MILAHRGNPAEFDRFLAEAESMAQLSHPGIVQVHEIGRWQESPGSPSNPFIVMQYIDGTNLGEIIKKQRKMPLEVALHICHQVAEGLKYAHNMGLVHRDIKPGNIMLSFDGRVMITDFGIAKSSGDLTITSTGQVIGSPSYMAPEQATGRPMDHRSDLFSLGIILYEIVAGEKPFNGDTYQSLVTSIMSEYPVSLREYRIDVTKEIDELVQKALVKMIDSRYQSAEEFSEAISAQFSKFKVQSPRKTMADYLKNPIKVTEKLRNDKISDHMESALYYLAVGEGKLAEAKREFLDVLRFDKNNKDARKYLTRLETQLPQEKGNDKFWDLKLNSGVSYAIGILAIIILLYVTFSNLPQTADHKASSGVEIVTESGEGSKGRKSEKSGYDAITKPVIPATSASKDNQLDPNDRGHTRSGRSGHTISAAPGTNYDYPQQNLVRYGTVSVATNVSAKIMIDYKNYGRSNGPPIKLVPGRHFVEAGAEGYVTAARRIFLRTGETDTLRLELARRQ
jgi:serine/threonine protein kinase